MKYGTDSGLDLVTCGQDMEPAFRLGRPSCSATSTRPAKHASVRTHYIVYLSSSLQVDQRLVCPTFFRVFSIFIFLFLFLSILPLLPLLCSLSAPTCFFLPCTVTIAFPAPPRTTFLASVQFPIIYTWNVRLSASLFYCCGSGIFIPDPNFFFSDLGSGSASKNSSI